MVLKFFDNSGFTIEADNPLEMCEFIGLRQSQASINEPGVEASGVIKDTRFFPKEEKISAKNSFSVENWLKALGDWRLQEVLRVIARLGSTGTIPKDKLDQQIEKKSLSGMGRIFSSKVQVDGLRLQDFIKLAPSKGVYELNKTAFKNLEKALERFDSQIKE